MQPIEQRIRNLNVNLLDDSRRITGNHHKVRDVLGHHASSADSDATPNSDARTNHHVSAKPAVRAYSDRGTEFRPIDAIAEERVERVRSGVESAVRADESAVSDGDETRVEEDGVEVDIHSLSDAEIDAVVDLDGRVYVGVVWEEGRVFFGCCGDRWEGCLIFDDAGYMLD